MASFENPEVLEIRTDAEGSSYKIIKTLFRGEDVTYPPGYEGLNHVLYNIGALQCKPDDIVLITFPKSGTHWVHKIISVIIGQGTVSAETYFIDIIKNVERDWKQESQPIVFGSHLKMKFLPHTFFTRQKVIYVIRNPKSIAASAFSHRTRSNESEYDGSFTGYLPLFLQGEFTCIGNWFQHVKHYWKALKGKPNVLFVFYEELKKNPVEVIQDISTFLGYYHNKDFLTRMVRETTFGNMKEQEQAELVTEGNVYWKEGQEGILRKGANDDWKNYFTVAQNEMYDEIFNKEMHDMHNLIHRIQFE